ncbi:MAG: SDR family NAD(P)-dependent oxidoreductase [Chloroflexi bacterium]|nr:SDR family NAD(P)-dependent oxidoreductase [Chloroflexota bacterium]
MPRRFQDKVVVIAGSTGGLGSAFAHAFAIEGAKLVLAGRDTEALNALAAELGVNARTVSMDLTDPASLSTLRDFVGEAFGRVDIVVNATGVDVRKPFDNHSLSDFRRTLDVNLMGAFLLTQTFLPLMREQNDGVIVHIGGFADGRLAFPYYSADVATRAGLFSFVESLNRELRMGGSQVVIAYFSPSAADTKAEQPFHPIWQEMGLTITPKEKVAAALLNTIEKRKQVHIMGGISTALFAKLNSIWPRLADLLLLNRYGSILKRFLAAESKTAPIQKSAQARWVGIGLIALSFLLYGGLLALPFLPIATQDKLTLSPILIILGETSFWVGGFIVGKEVIARYKQYLDPCYWLCCQSSNAGATQQ